MASLTQIPLVRQMLSDPQVRLCSRGVDRTWSYQGVLPGSTTGFHPLRKEIYFAHESRMASWLARPEAPVRPLNDNDFLMQEVLFAAHDYLHCWAASAIQSLQPELGFGTSALRAKDLEHWAFCLLLTEAVATVGLDYWYLAQVQLGAVVPCGTTLRCLTVSYRQEELAEFQQFAPGFDALTPAFFGEITRFYCTGAWAGFSAEDLNHSPLLLRWLKHELTYGSLQRIYARTWLAHLAGVELTDAPGRAVGCDEPWQRDLVERITPLLWQLVREDRRTDFGVLPPLHPSWRGDPARFDFRFNNLNTLEEPDLVERLRELDGGPQLAREWACRQLLSRHRFQSVPRSVRPIAANLLSQARPSLLHALLADVERVGGEQAHRDLFLLN